MAFMESVASSSSMSVPQEAYNFDEFFMQQSLLFSDSLKDLRNLKKQLYSAAEYFEISYTKDDQEQLVMDALKDYTIKALINTVDHLGSMAYKVNNFLDEKVGEVSRIELRVSCIEQRERTCREFINYGGHRQQTLAVKTPKYHKQYIFPGKYVLHCYIHFSFYNFRMHFLFQLFILEHNGDNMFEITWFLKFICSAGDADMYAVGQTESKFHSCSLCAENDLHQFKKAVQATTITPSWLARNAPSASPFSQSSSSPRTFNFTRIASNKDLEKPRVSPHHFPLIRCGSLVTRSPTPNFPLIRSGSLATRYHSPNSLNAKGQYPTEPRRTISLGTHSELEGTKEIQQYSSKSKRLLRALLSVRKPKKDGTLYRYLDEY